MVTIRIVIVAALVSLLGACGSNQSTDATGNDAGEDATTGDDGGGDGPAGPDSITERDSSAGPDGLQGMDSSTGGDTSEVQDSAAGGDTSTAQDSSTGIDSSTPTDSSTATDSSVDSSGQDSSESDSAADSSSPEASTKPDASDSGSPCGACPSGFTCGASGYCVDPGGIPAFDHVYLILMENHSLSSIQGDTKATYINGTLLKNYAYATDYTTSAHPSLPNYITLTSGSAQSVGCDCSPGTGTACSGFNCSLIANSCNCGGITAKHIGDQLDVAGIGWKNYGESMGTSCNTTNGGVGLYAAKHVPFLYYADVGGDSTACPKHIVDYSAFSADLAAGSVRYSFITPNLCSDMHNTCAPDNEPIQQGDQWLAANVPPIVSAMRGTDVLFIVWDEQDTFGATEIPLVVVSPIAKAGPTGTAYTHASLLATIEEGFGLTKLPGAAQATVIADVWK